MHKWMHKAAGGTIHRLNPGLAIEWVRSSIEPSPIERLPFVFSARVTVRHSTAACADRSEGEFDAKIAHFVILDNAIEQSMAERQS
jgi:hypothetical protein